MTRIGVIGPLGPDLFADNVLDCLPDLGVDAVPLGMPRREFKDRRVRAAQDFLGRALPNLDDKWQQKIGQRAVDEGCDLVISVWGELMPGAVKTMRDAGIPVALWFPDHIANLGRGLMFTAPYSHVYFKDPEVADRAARVQGLPASYLPEACNPHWHRPLGGEPGDDPGIVVAGNIYSTRAILLARMQADGFPLRLYGPAMPTWLPERAALAPAHTGGYIAREDKARVFRRGAAVLNNLHPSELTSMNCRLFEAAGSGAAVLTEWRGTLPDLFEPGEEVLAFTTYDELQSHWKRLINEPELGKVLGDAATRRAHAEHTYQHRLRVVLEDTVR